ncbi:hypothetical protein [Verrucomicrobium sp. BvORR106]|uniref:hypothetical protein n=1 Tax=Verrucomicrobium sp. BvORR106 TaxID=1403819 RepID=UPI00056E8942|nr:hypothetical protein [Verrucomicrobium sp. BvORR106]
MSDDIEVVLGNAQSTLDKAATLLGTLAVRFAPPGGQPAAVEQFWMTPRHALELYRYLKAYRDRLEGFHTRLKKEHAAGTSPSALYIQLLDDQRFELETAREFVQEAFIKPRTSGTRPLALEVADWICVEGFQLFVKKYTERKSGEESTPAVSAQNYPLGPLVAIDSRRTPAVWDDDTQLSIPSLFDLTARVMRTPQSSLSGLAVFPVITLPADLSELPEYYALLSHEVGHAADAAFGITKLILAEIGKQAAGLQRLDYWRAWMREIVADAAGVALSGDAFALAWWRYVMPLKRQRDLTCSNAYPPTLLRREFIRQMLASRSELAPAVPPEFPELPPGELPEYHPFKEEFAAFVLPQLQQCIFAAVPDPVAEESFVRASALAGDALVVDAKKLWERKPLRALPSVITQAVGRVADYYSWGSLHHWHEAYKRQNNVPGWHTQTTSNWAFTKDYLPSLRPTIMGTDGVTKFPPRVLLLNHHKIAFLGATQKWLLKALEETLLLRKEPWESMEIYFASDSLLESVEYHSPRGRRRTVRSVRHERDKVISRLKTFFQRTPRCCKRVRFYLFNGPPVFGSFWDWDQPGGRIHISSQLAGVCLSKCPAIDHIWLQDTPTFTYEQYRKCLRNIRSRSVPVSL